MRALCVALGVLVAAGCAVGCRNDVLLGQLSDGGAAVTDAATGLGSRIGPGSRIPWNGGQYFLHGANLPWIGYSRDFGGTDGLSDPTTRSLAESAFQDARSGGFRVVRWVMFAADESTTPLPVITTSTGIPNGFTSAVLRDLDAALQLAEVYDVYLILVPFTLAQPSAARMSDAAQRQGLADAMATLVRHAAPAGRVLAWEVSPTAATQAQLADLIRRLAPLVRESAAYLTSHVVTLDQAAALCAAGADFVGFGNLVTQNPIDSRSVSYDSISPAPECPVLVDVIYVPDAVGADSLRAVRDRGWAGTLAWALSQQGLSPDPEQEIDFAEAASFAAGESETGPP